MTKINSLLLALLFFTYSNASAETGIDAYELIYDEQETGTDPYQVKFTVTNRYLRIDQLGDQSGYVIYDNKQQLVHSVVHHDESVLVIPKYDYQKPDLSKTVEVSYSIIPDAPKIASQSIYSYRVNAADKNKEKCMDIILAEGLLPEVSSVLISYQKMLAGQQSRLLKTTPKEYQSSCFLYDQVFNEGDYYHKGLPIQEWHSNGKRRLLVSYKKVKVDPVIFKSEKAYKRYSLD